MTSATKGARELWAVLGPLWQAQPRALVLGALLAAVTVLAGMALLGVSGWFITATALAGLQPLTAIVFDVFMPSAAIRLLALGRTASRYGERLVTHGATLAGLAALRERLFRAWAGPESARRLLLQPARLLFRLTADIDALESVYLRIAVPAVAALGAALLAGVVLGGLHPALGAAVALWLLASAWGVALVVARRARPAAVRRAHAIELLRARAVDLVAGQTDLIMAGRMDAQRAALAAADQTLARADLALNRLEARAGAAYGMVGTVTLVGVLLAVGVLVEAGTIGAPGAALALLVALAAGEPLAALRRGALEAGRSWLAARRLAPGMVVPSAHAGRPPRPPAPLSVQLTDATVAHAGSPLPTLDPLRLQIMQGERVAIVGPSGAGKSTLLALVAGELAPQAGQVQAEAASWLTQRTELFQDSLRDNLRLADPSADDARLWAVLHTAGLADDAQALRRGLDSPLGEGGLGLSGGQARRLALARLLLRPVPLWLLDEPTEALDTDTAHDVLQRLGRACAKRTMLIATHLRREAALADRLLCLRQGRVVADLRRGSREFEAALAALRPD